MNCKLFIHSKKLNNTTSRLCIAITAILCIALICASSVCLSFFGSHTRYFDASYVNVTSDKSGISYILPQKVSVDDNQEVIAAYSFETGDENEYFVPVFKNLPKVDESESISVYGNKNGKLEKLAKTNVKNGDKCYLGMFAYDGISLIKEMPGVKVIMQTLTSKPEEGVSVSFEGYMPEGVTAKIVPAKGKGILSYDIKLYDSDNKEFQPTVGHPLKVTVESKKLKKSKTRRIEAVHVSEEGETEEAKTLNVAKNSITFLAQHFSEYTIRYHDTDSGDPVTPRRTYHFLDYEMEEIDMGGGETEMISKPFMFFNTAGDRQSTQIIKDKDKLEAIPIPGVRDGLYFYGWYVVNYISSENGNVRYKWDANPERVEFNRMITVSETVDTDIYVAPLYSNYRFVTFHENEEDQSSGINVLTRKLVALGENRYKDILISDVRAQPPDGQRVVFWGWNNEGTIIQTVDEENTEVEKYIRVDETDTECHLYPVFLQARWITFDTGGSGNGAKYVPSRFVVQGNSVETLRTTTRPGYRFGSIVNGTYDLGDNNIINNGQLTLDEDLKLYARWTEISTADYTVVFWKQSVNDDKNATVKTYDYDTTETRNGASGTTLTPTNADMNKNYEGFYYSHYTVNNDNKIKSDDTTVMNVYYDRDLRVINFYYQRNDTAPSDAVSPAYIYSATTGNDGTQYGFVDNEYVQLTRENGSTVTEYFLTQTDGSTTEYTGNVYERNGNNYSAVTNPQYPNTYYRRRNNGNYSQLYWNTRTTTSYTWTYNGNEYKGTRYTRTTSSTYTKMLTWTGLYGQTFAQNGYAWTDVSAYQWQDDNQTQSLLDSFIQDNPYNLYRSGTPGNNYIYHYKQNLDGTYSIENRVAARYSATSANFTFTGNNGFSASGGSRSVNPGNSAPVNLPLHVYHKRNTWSLTINYNYAGSPQSYVINNIPYGARIGDYINTNADYYNPEREHYNFLGWYKADVGDVNDAPDIDLNSTMPNANMVMYAHWDHIWYLVEVDPNGAELDHINGTDRPSTYFWLAYGDTIGEYKNISRTHVPDENGDYVYLNTTFNDENAGYGINANLRNALFIPYRADGDYHDYYNNEDFGGYTYASSGMSYETFRSCISNQRYRELYGNESYTLMGWYLVNEDGTMSSSQYNFGDKVDSNRKIRAVWKRNELYYLAYNPVMTGANIGGTITQTTDPDAANFDGGKYTDRAAAVALAGPTDITPGYAFEGWRIVDGLGNPLEDGVYYDPGEEFYINSDFANSSGCIHLEAFYEPTDNMMRRVSVAKLLLDANGGEVNDHGLPGDSYIYADTDDEVLHFEKQINNTAVELMSYYRNFTHSTGYMLLGWNDTADPGNYVPKHAADAEIGIDKNAPNTLYAVWEPMVYLTFVNQTADSLEVNVSFSNYNGTVYTGHINEVISPFGREPYTSSKITLAPGETIKFVLPEGDGATYSFSGAYRGSKDKLYIHNAGISTQTVNKNNSYNGTGTLITDKTGRVVTFYDEEQFIPPPTGTNLNLKSYALLLLPATALAAGMIIIISRKRRGGTGSI